MDSLCKGPNEGFGNFLSCKIETQLLTQIQKKLKQSR